MKNLNKKGFTLMELLVVVLIVSILASFALPQYFINVELAKAREALDYARLWQGAREIYFAQHESFPSDNNALVIDGDFTNRALYFTQEDSALNTSGGYALFTRTTGIYAIKAAAQGSEVSCCWPTNNDDNRKGQKICDNLAPITAENENTTTFSTWTCRVIPEIE